MNGMLVVLEGINSAGKDTQSDRLSEQVGCEVMHYPDFFNPVGELIGKFLNNELELSPEVQFLLYAADMLKDKSSIRKMLGEGKTVILNRYITSTIAYQSVQGFSMDKAISFAESFGFLKPDRIIYLDISPKTSIKRKAVEKGNVDRFEGLEFQQKIYKAYRELISRNFMANWTVLDGEQAPEKVTEEITKALS